MSRIEKKQIALNGRIFRHSYSVSSFNGELKKHKFSRFYFVGLNKKAKIIELSNGTGSFYSYLDPQDALRAAIEGQKAVVERAEGILSKMQGQLTKRKARNQLNKFCVDCLKPTRLLVHCHKFTQKRG